MSKILKNLMSKLQITEITKNIVRLLNFKLNRYLTFLFGVILHALAYQLCSGTCLFVVTTG